MKSNQYVVDNIIRCYFLYVKHFVVPKNNHSNKRIIETLEMMKVSENIYMTAKEIFAQRLLYLRKEKEISRQKVADDLGITRASLEFYEKGKRTPDINTIVKIAEYYGVSTDYLLGVSDFRNPNSEEIIKQTGLSDKAVEFLNSDKVNLKITNALLSSDTANLKKWFLYMYVYLRIDDVGDIARNNWTDFSYLDEVLKEKIGFGMDKDLTMLEPALMLLSLDRATEALEDILTSIRRRSNLPNELKELAEIDEGEADNGEH